MKKQNRPLLDLLLSIVLPAVILMRLSGDDELGARNALILALAFPICWGLYELRRSGRVNFIAMLGVISVLLTGGIGLLALDARWLAVKEAAIPGLIGAGILIGAWLRYPLVKVMFFNPQVMNTSRITERLNERGHMELFEHQLNKATYALSGTFFFSALMNYILAVKIVTSTAGTPEFNEELGQLTLISYPLIALPSMLMMGGILYFLWRIIKHNTGLTLEEAFDTTSNEE